MKWCLHLNAPPPLIQTHSFSLSLSVCLSFARTFIFVRSSFVGFFSFIFVVSFSLFLIFNSVCGGVCLLCLSLSFHPLLRLSLSRAVICIIRIMCRTHTVLQPFIRWHYRDGCISCCVLPFALVCAVCFIFLLSWKNAEFQSPFDSITTQRARNDYHCSCYPASELHLEHPEPTLAKT